MSITVMSPPDPSAAAAEQRRQLNRKLRAAFLAGAEEESRQATRRGLTDKELRQVVRRYPGDLPER